MKYLMMFLLFLCLFFPYTTAISVSVLRQCNNDCRTANLYCPTGHSVEVHKNLLCVDQLNLRPEQVGRWFRFSSANLTVHVRLLRACFDNRVLGSCLGLHGKCMRGSTMLLQSHFDGTDFRYTLCIHAFLKADLVGFRCVYKTSGFSCTKQFIAGNGHHHDLAQLSPGQGKTPEDDYEYDGEWFLWETPKPGSGY